MYLETIIASNTKIIYERIFPKILNLRVLLLGRSELAETIESLIQLNQKVALDLNAADQDTRLGVEIEESLDQLVNEIQRRQEENGFITEADIEELQQNAIELTAKIASQESIRDSIKIEN